MMKLEVRSDEVRNPSRASMVYNIQTLCHYSLISLTPLVELYSLVMAKTLLKKRKTVIIHQT